MHIQMKQGMWWVQSPESTDCYILQSVKLTLDASIHGVFYILEVARRRLKPRPPKSATEVVS